MILSNNGKKLLAIVAGAVALWALTYQGLSLYGKHAWRETKASLLAQGEHLSLDELAPPKVPEEENFLAAPLWRESQSSPKRGPNFATELTKSLGGAKQNAAPVRANLTGYNQPIDLDYAAKNFGRINQTQPDSETVPQFLLRQISPAAPALTALAEAAQRPHSRYLDSYASLSTRPQGLTAINWEYWQNLTKALGFRAIIACANNAGDAALQDVLTLTRIIQHLEPEPLMELKIIRLELIRNVTRIVWLGLYYQCWSNAELQELEASLSSITVWPSLIKAHQGQRARLLQWAEPLAETEGLEGLYRSYHNPDFESDTPGFLFLFPPGLAFADFASYSLYIHDFIRKAADPSFPRVQLIQKRSPVDLGLLEAAYPQKLSIDQSKAWLIGHTRATLELDVRLRQTLIGLKLEAYHRAHQSYPPTLADLPNLPMNPMTDMPFDYRLGCSGGYTLWSPALKREGSENPAVAKDDWSWEMPGERPAPAP